MCVGTWPGGCGGQRVRSSWGCVQRGSTEQDGHLGAALGNPRGGEHRDWCRSCRFQSWWTAIAVCAKGSVAQKQRAALCWGESRAHRAALSWGRLCVQGCTLHNCHWRHCWRWPCELMTGCFLPFVAGTATGASPTLVRVIMAAAAARTYGFDAFATARWGAAGPCEAALPGQERSRPRSVRVGPAALRAKRTERGLGSGPGTCRLCWELQAELRWAQPLAPHYAGAALWICFPSFGVTFAVSPNSKSFKPKGAVKHHQMWNGIANWERSLENDFGKQADELCQRLQTHFERIPPFPRARTPRDEVRFPLSGRLGLCYGIFIGFFLPPCLPGARRSTRAAVCSTWWFSPCICSSWGSDDR